MNRLLKTVSLMSLTFLSTACVSSETDDNWESLTKSGGQGIYTEKCGMCHQGIGMGVGILGRRMDADLALLENRTDLQPIIIETAVRRGFGVMLPLSRGEVSDAQLEAITDYLVKGD